MANSINNRKNIGVLKSEDIFSRLFYQGDKIDKDLLHIGEVCSLFFSFDISFNLADEQNELNIISKLLNSDSINIFTRVEELSQRQIIQKRGNMRAVLPHALANKLAIDCLRKYPPEMLLEIISKNKRLYLSFFRRLKFLHLSNEAQKIGKIFISSIGNDEIIDSDRDLIEKIRCVTIINPKLVLEKIESVQSEEFFSSENGNYDEWVHILCIIAYDKNLFKRAISIMISFVLAEKTGENYNSIRHTLKSFFHIYLSYTYATVFDKLEIVDELINSNDKKRSDLGVSLLIELLSIGGFIGVPVSDCGSQIRDYGLEPNLGEWYDAIINYLEKMLQYDELFEKAKDIIIIHFKDLSSIGYYNRLEKIVLKYLNKGSWVKLWTSLLSIKYFDKDKISETLMKKIDLLIEMVRPKSIEEKIETYLGRGKKIFFELDDTTDDYDSIDEMIYELGRSVGKQNKGIIKYLNLMDNTCDLFRLGQFAHGIFDEYDNTEELIYLILDLYSDNNSNVIKCLISNIMAFYHLKDSNDCSKTLDNLVESEKYKHFYTLVQLTYRLDESDFYRIRKQIINNNFNNEDLYTLEFYVSELDISLFCSLVELLIRYNYNSILIIYLIFRYSEENKLNNKLKEITRKEIANVDFVNLKKSNNLDTYVISKVVKTVFEGKDGCEEARSIFDIISSKLDDNNYLSFYDLEDVFVPLIQMYPFEFLNSFINYNNKPTYEKKHFLIDELNSRNVLSYIDDDIIIKWLVDNGKVFEISYVIQPYLFDTKMNHFYWSNLGIYIFENYYDNELIINNIINGIYPSSWSNEYSSVLKRRVNLFVQLRESNNLKISCLGEKGLKEINKSIERSLEEEKEENNSRFNTFEH